VALAGVDRNPTLENPWQIGDSLCELGFGSS
jgi:hypothetical protein